MRTNEAKGTEAKKGGEGIIDRFIHHRIAIFLPAKIFKLLSLFFPGILLKSANLECPDDAVDLRRTAAAEEGGNPWSFPEFSMMILLCSLL